MTGNKRKKKMFTPQQIRHKDSCKAIDRMLFDKLDIVIPG
jgi:hypothetical protein